MQENRELYNSGKQRQIKFLGDNLESEIFEALEEHTYLKDFFKRSSLLEKKGKGYITGITELEENTYIIKLSELGEETLITELGGFQDIKNKIYLASENFNQEKNIVYFISKEGKVVEKIYKNGRIKEINSTKNEKLNYVNKNGNIVNYKIKKEDIYRITKRPGPKPGLRITLDTTIPEPTNKDLEQITGAYDFSDVENINKLRDEFFLDELYREDV